MGVFGAVFVCRGDVGFSGPMLGVSSGAGGFNVAALLRLACNILRPARPDVGVSAKKFSLRRCLIVKARKGSPCALKLGRNWRFMARWASFVAEMPLEGRCWANFFALTGAVPRTCRQCGALQAGGGGGLRHAKPSGGVSPACRRLGWRHSPRLVAVRTHCLMCAQKFRT